MTKPKHPSVPLDLTPIRDALRRARAADEPYDSADQWAMLGSHVPDLLAEIDRLQAEAKSAQATAARLGEHLSEIGPALHHARDEILGLRASAATS